MLTRLCNSMSSQHARISPSVRSIAECIMSTMQNLAHNVNSGLLVMSLCNFESKDVKKCVFILHNVLRFLNCGIAGFDRTPPMLMDHLFDIFMTASNTQFCNCVQNLKDWPMMVLVHSAQKSLVRDRSFQFSNFDIFWSRRHFSPI